MVTKAERASKTGGGLEASWEATHRSGLCEKCHTRMEDYFDTGKRVIKCPQCGGVLGELIAVLKKRGRWFMYFFGNWERERIEYCQRHRRDPVPQSLREGKVSISTMLYTWRKRRAGVWNGVS